ncbi:Mpped2, partial [Symbiodinium sp. KB8]
MALPFAAWAMGFPWCAGVAPLAAAWAAGLPYGHGDDLSVKENHRYFCMLNGTMQLLSPRDSCNDVEFDRPPEDDINMQGIGGTETEVAMNSGTEFLDEGLDSGLRHAARREPIPQDLAGYTIRHINNTGTDRYDSWEMDDMDTEVVELMQTSKGTSSWFLKAKTGFNNLQRSGASRQAALMLRDRLRCLDDPNLRRTIQAHLPDILAGDGPTDDTMDATTEAWVEYVLQELARIAGLSPEARNVLLCPQGALELGRHGAVPAVDTHRGPPTWGISYAEAVAATTSTCRRVEEQVSEDGDLDRELEANGRWREGESDDATALFQRGRPLSSEQAWLDLMEQLQQWFQEDRAVQLALAMLRQRTQERNNADYQRWVVEPLRRVGEGLEPNEQASRERTPPDFYRWSRRVEGLLYQAYLIEHTNPGDEVSMMDRYRNGRRRIRDSRTPRRDARREARRGTVTVTTETRRLEGRRPASGSGGPSSGEGAGGSTRHATGSGEVALRPRGEHRTSERASGSTDRPRHAPATCRAGGFDLPDPQQPMSMQQAVTTWKYLLFDRWAFNPPEATGVVPDSWLPQDTLRNVSTHLATMNEHNLMMLTMGMVTMIRYMMAELSQSLDMAQVVLNTARGEPGVDLDEEEVEDAEELDLMQRFFDTDGKDSPPRRWARAMMRLHKELESQPKAQRGQSVAALRSAMPPMSDVAETNQWQVQLQSLLVAVSEGCTEIQGALPLPVAWFETWVTELRDFIPGYCSSQPPQLLETQLDVNIDELLQDEEEERALRIAREQQQEEEEGRRAEYERLQELELQHLTEEAKEYQDWERTVTERELKRPAGASPDPSKRRCLVTLEVASSSSTGPARRVQTLGYELPLTGEPLSFTLRATMEETPSEVSTVDVPMDVPAVAEMEYPGAEGEGGDAPPEGRPMQPSNVNTQSTIPAQEAGMSDLGMESLRVSRPSQVDLLGLLEFEEYAKIYDRWRKGELTQQEVEQRYGPDVVEMVLAQEAVRDALDGENSEAEDIDHPELLHETSGLAGPPLQARRRYGDFELVYGEWKTGQSTDGDILTKYGPEWLSLFQHWRLWGLEAIWGQLHRVLDMETSEDATTKAATAMRPPEPLELPLRVPRFAVEDLFQRWTRKEIGSEVVRQEYGDIWLRLLHKMQTDGIEKLKLGWSALVDWDAEAEDTRVTEAARDQARSPMLDFGGETGPQGMILAPDGGWTRLTLRQFEDMYEAWKRGEVRDEHVRLRHGVDFLAVLIQRRAWGLEAVWDYLVKLIDILPDRASASRPANGHCLPPEELVLPLKVPWSSVKELLRRWQAGEVPDCTVQANFGDEWYRLLQRVRRDGITSRWEDLNAKVLWDVPPEMPKNDGRIKALELEPLPGNASRIRE